MRSPTSSLRRTGPQLVARYWREFRPGLVATPRAIVAVAALCADTDAEADWQQRPPIYGAWGPRVAAVRPSSRAREAAAARLTDLQRVRVAQAQAKVFVGSPDRVRSALTALAGDFGVDELLVVTVCHDPEARIRSY